MRRSKLLSQDVIQLCALPSAARGLNSLGRGPFVVSEGVLVKIRQSFTGVGAECRAVAGQSTKGERSRTRYTSRASPLIKEMRRTKRRTKGRGTSKAVKAVLSPSLPGRGDDEGERLRQ
jgi:hypothetical protein